MNLPFDEGLKTERKLFQELMGGMQSAAQRYVFFAERQVWKIPDVPDDTPTLPIKKVGIIGAGTMGGGIAMNFANVGIPVTIVEMKQEALDRGLGVIRKNYETTAKRGKLKPEDVEKRMGLLTGVAASWKSWPTATWSSRRCSRAWTSRRTCSASSTRSPSRARSSPPTPPI